MSEVMEVSKSESARTGMTSPKDEISQPEPAAPSGAKTLDIRISYFLPPRIYKREGDKLREYMFGRRVIPSKEMREMECPVPPENDT